MKTRGHPRPLPAFRVVELGGPAIQYAGKLLADLGCDVIKVEPPGGDPARLEPPFGGQEATGLASLPFAYYNAGKRSMVLDVASPSDRQTLHRLLVSADAALDGLAPGETDGLGVRPEEIRSENPGLVWTSVTPFGLTGPYAGFEATDLVVFAMGGIMNVSGRPDLPPVVAPWHQAYQLASVHAAYGTLLALLDRLHTGHGRLVEISAWEAVATEPVLNQITRYGLKGETMQRNGGQLAEVPGALYPCRDGYVFLEAHEPHNWREFWDWLGHPDALTGEYWEHRLVRRAHIDIVEPYVLDLCRQRAREQLYREGQARHLPAASVRRPDELIQSDQSRARALFTSVEDPVLGPLPYVRPPYLFSACTVGPRSPAPALGQHMPQILKELRVYPGLNGAPEGPTRDPGPRTQDPGLKTRNPKPETPSLPLAGVRVLALTAQAAGPTLTRLLADYGADVLTVETGRRPRQPLLTDELDALGRYERHLMFHATHRNQRSITLDLSSEEGRALARRLIRISDVVVENFSLGVLERWGLDYRSMRTLRPDLVLISLQGLGRTGPDRHHVSAGYTLLALSGMTHLWGYREDDRPAGTRSAYPDFLAAAHGAVAVAAALLRRDQTGEGTHVDLAQLEAVAAVLGPAYLEYAATGREPQPLGNASRQWAPHGCYPCRGDDRWCVLVATSDEEWAALCAATGHLEWLHDERFAGNQARLSHLDALDGLIADWTRRHTPHQVMFILQRAGVPAAPVMNGEDLFLDPHLRARDFILQMEDREIGPIAHSGPAIRFDLRRPGIRWPAPPMGRDNDYVYREVLGMPPDHLGTGAR